MNQTQTIHTTSSVSSTKMLQAMVGIGIMCALMIVLTFEGTKSRIAHNKAEALEKAIFKVIPGMVKKRTYQLNENSSFDTIRSEIKDASLVYAGYDENDQLVGMAIEASGIGFADIIRILYGYNPETQKIVGFYVLESKETPGLGDKIEKDENFLSNFSALDVTLVEDLSAIKNEIIPVKQGAKENPWEVDGITGATISSRSIGNILSESTSHWVPLIYKNRRSFDIKK
ncbi:MAG: FMN-binding protein [Bacteroidetes bacterium]|jgi:electron transport complex protein RnfG|nr:FMN-binding protein [Bacteroidota bacterium]MDF1863878.1 FMN-binding protein [Saprospiraceae bacterium]